LDTEDASGSTLAGETVADRDSNRLSLDGESELLTTTRGVSSADERIVDRVGSGDIPEYWPSRARVSPEPDSLAYGLEVNSFQCPSETISTVPSVTLMAV
jgi:hypothetical protein